MKNRGMFLEQILNTTIRYYLHNNIAWFEKKFTPIIQKSDRTIRVKSTTDYYGIYQGKYISIEAKSFQGTRYDLANIKQHQKEHLNKILQFGGYGFYIFYVDIISKFYLVNAQHINSLQVKSIDLSFFKIYAQEITIELPGILDFLNLIKTD